MLWHKGLCDIMVAIQTGMNTSFLNLKIWNKRSNNFFSWPFYGWVEQSNFILLKTTSNKHEDVRMEPKNTNGKPTKAWVWDSLVFRKQEKCTRCTLKIHNIDNRLTFKPFINLTFTIVSLFKALHNVSAGSCEMFKLEE